MACSGKDACILLPILVQNACGSSRSGVGATIDYCLAWVICVCLLCGFVCMGRSTQIVRILITASPRMYREALALSAHRHRSDLEVRIAPPEEISEEVRSFRPHLLVRNDTDGLDPKVLAGVPCWVEVLYSDSMDVRIGVDGRIDEIHDICMEDLLAVIDEATELVSEAS